MSPRSTRITLCSLATLVAAAPIGCSAPSRVYPDDDAGVGGSSATGGSRTVPGKTLAVGGTSTNGGASTGGVGDVASSGGTSSLAGASGIAGEPATGGTSSIAGASAIGGNPPTGGNPGIAGNPSTGGNGATGGNPSTSTGGRSGTSAGGSSNASGGASITGGASTILVTGGAPTAGGAATGGTPATGGAATGGTSACSVSTCSGKCVDVQSDKLNCGTCGHDCLGGECLKGQCQPAVVEVATNGSSAPKVILVDDTYVYFSVAAVLPNIAWYRAKKTDLNGTGTYEFSRGAGLSSLIGGQLYWHGYMGDSIYNCSYNDCAGTETNWGSSKGTIIPNLSVTTQQLATWSTTCLYGNFCINWFKSDGTIAKTYYDTYQPAAGNSVSGSSYLQSGAFVYWVSTEKDSQSNFVKAVLFRVDSTSGSRAQLAGSLFQQSVLLNVADASVILADSSDVQIGSDATLYRVPLPLGLGSQGPQSLGVQGIAGIEDGSSFYWFDAQGTLYRCTWSNCAATMAILANGQSDASQIMQDSNAIYWGRGNPLEIMRLAK